MGVLYNRKPCVCVETGVEFESEAEMAAYLGITKQYASNIVRQGKSHHGLHYTIKDDPHPPALKYHKKAVICVETGEMFSSQKEAVKKYGVGVRDSAKNGGVRATRRGMHFYFSHESPPTDCLPPNTMTQAKMVVCVENGNVYESMKAAARAIGCSRQNVSQAVKSGRKIKGLTYILLDKSINPYIGE